MREAGLFEILSGRQAPEFTGPPRQYNRKEFSKRKRVFYRKEKCMLSCPNAKHTCTQLSPAIICIYIFTFDLNYMSMHTHIHIYSTFNSILQ